MFPVLADLEKLSVARFKRATQEKLRDVRCPEHHRAPRLRFNGASLRQMTISISGCCPKLMQIANARIAAASDPAGNPVPSDRPSR